MGISKDNDPGACTDEMLRGHRGQRKSSKLAGGGRELLEVLIGHLSKDAVRRDTRCTPGAGEGPAITLTWDVSEAKHA